MSLTRVTQNMLTQRSLEGMQIAASRMAKVQEQLTTGSMVNRPSDSPTSTTASMRMRSTMADADQYARNAGDGLGWLGQIDSTLQSMIDQTRRARDLTIQGRSATVSTQSARAALAVEVEEIRASLVAAANSTYLGRPVFGGVTGGGIAYNSDGEYQGSTSGQVTRTVADGVTVRVDVDGRHAFGADGDNLFDALDLAADALVAGDMDALGDAMDKLSVAMERMTGALAEVGGVTKRVDLALQAAKDSKLSMRGTLSEIEDVDIAEAAMELGLKEVAYQTALSAAARVIQPSLVDFLR